MSNNTPPHMEKDQRDSRNVGGGQRLRLPGVPDAPATTGEKPTHQVEHRTPADPMVYRIVRTPTENAPTEVRTRQDTGDGGRERQVASEQPTRFQCWRVICGKQG